jgi:uncharacterized membrane protein YcaP (DUF421 family)
MNEKELRTLRSMKVIRQKNLEGINRGWFQEQELRKVRRQIEDIEVVLRMREAQERLF